MDIVRVFCSNKATAMILRTDHQDHVSTRFIFSNEAEKCEDITFCLGKMMT
jgi:hypothetical protein